MKRLLNAVAVGSVFLSAVTIHAVAAYASPVYELATTTPPAGGNIAVYRLNVASGEVANVTSYPAINIVEPAPIPPGNYRLYVVMASGGTYWLYRLETESGRTWFFANNTWNESTRTK